MTTDTYGTPELTFPSEPISDDTFARVSLIGTDWRADRDWRIFEFACRLVARQHDGQVDPNHVREELTDQWGDLQIDPQRYASFWGLATRPSCGRPRKGRPVRTPFLDNVGWGINHDKGSRNEGKPIRIRALRKAAA